MNARENGASETDHHRVASPSGGPLPTRRKLLAGLGTSGGSIVFLSGCLGEDGSDVNSGGDETDSEDVTEGDEREDDSDGEATAGGDDDTDRADGGSTEDSSPDESDESDDGADDTEKEESDGDLDVEFVSCARAEITGSFDDGDLAYASTGFYDEGLYGNTLLEDGITFGEDVETPFSGTVVLEIGDEPTVEESADEIVVGIPEYGSDGTVLTGLTTDPDDYAGGGISHGNPNADSCLDEIGAGESGGAVEVSILETNTPIDGGEYLDVTAEIVNAGEAEATDEIRLVVGHDPKEVDSQTLTVGPGETETVRLGYETPSVGTDQEFPVSVESGDDDAREDVLVYGSP